MLFRARKSLKGFKLRSFPQNKEINLCIARKIEDIFIIIPKTWNKKDADRILNHNMFQERSVVLI
jgi:hypothetical protein